MARRPYRIDEGLECGLHQRRRFEEIGMIMLHIGDDGEIRIQSVKHIVVLIGFYDERLPRADAGISSPICQRAADDVTGVFARALQDMNDHGCRRRLAMRARYRNRIAIAQDRAHEVFALIHGDVLRQSRRYLCVVGGGGRCRQDIIRALDVARVVANVDARAIRRQCRGQRAALQVRAAYRIAALQQDARDGG